ncbi:group II intron maturase-specific domain-containing protein [Niallia sp. Man26]|uniref:group II intron maturase-specific domain-containing protein n=1 Tax=Niallia sp. Man26 TaxID=2912824 RepID=UPI001EDBECAD|nr:group II intron maturase-specific domain-containing protein [Niallia sp. Man26]UPO91055.1 hypothetical protein L8T27_027385 [Niallia sp. Man26]
MGFNIRKYKTHNGNKILIKASKDGIKAAKKKVIDKTRQFYGKNVQVLVSTLNPIIIGTANYWSPSVAKEVFTEMDSHGELNTSS